MYRAGKQTQGTETSKYLEERKATATPSVAASERGRMCPNRVYLTVRMAYVQPGLWECSVGVRAGRELQSRRLVEWFWKGPAIEGESPVGER